jgi:hypothetical protein
MSKSSFDDLTDLYEAMIDWPKRSANEAPFFRRLCEHSIVRRVADVACGTGRHADMFRSWGLEVRLMSLAWCFLCCFWKKGLLNPQSNGSCEPCWE